MSETPVTQPNLESMSPAELRMLAENSTPGRSSRRKRLLRA